MSGSTSAASQSFPSEYAAGSTSRSAFTDGTPACTRTRDRPTQPDTRPGLGPIRVFDSQSPCAAGKMQFASSARHNDSRCTVQGLVGQCSQ